MFAFLNFSFERKKSSADFFLGHWKNSKNILKIQCGQKRYSFTPDPANHTFFDSPYIYIYLNILVNSFKSIGLNLG